MHSPLINLTRIAQGLCALGLILSAFVVTHAQAQCTGGSYYNSSSGGTSRDYRYCNTARRYSTAGTDCAALLGGNWRLVTIDNLAEDNYVETLDGTTAGGNNVWIGYNDQTTEGAFIWSGDAQTVFYQNATFGGNSGANDCVRQNTAVTWTVVGCGGGVTNSYVCEDDVRCGNGMVSGTEECDDGNTTNYDGCSSTCQVEWPYTCTNTFTNSPVSTCTNLTNCANSRTAAIGTREYVYCRTNRTWANARTTCQGIAAGWDLAVVSDNTENTTIYNMWSADGLSGGSMFLGMSDTTADGNAASCWQWIDATVAKTAGGCGTAAFANWGTGEPNNGNPGQGCGSYWNGVPYQWDDIACGSTIPFTCEGPSICGNGLRASGDEECDDGNTANGDGCSSACLLETAPVCGDGAIAGLEACDDGNTTSGDGCSNVCVVEAGYTCAGTPSVCSTVCTGGTWFSSGTSNTTEYYRCTTAQSWGGARNNCSNLGTSWNLVTITGSTENTYVASILGGANRWIGIFDTNTEGTYEWASGTAVSYTTWNAGEPDAASDCAVMLNAATMGNWDQQNCGTTFGYICEGPPVCGNGKLASPEVCDDGNITNGDGCSSTCVEESGWSCTNVDANTASTCTQLCSGGTWSSYGIPSTPQSTEYFYCATAVSRSNARTNCQSIATGWDLVKIEGSTGTYAITAATENAHILANISSNRWIGLNDIASEGTYVWADSSANTYTNWAASEPTAGAADNCALMLSASGQWDQQACANLRGYICEGPAVCGNGVLALNENCDDGNTVNGDGCSSACNAEAGRRCTVANPSNCSTVSHASISTLRRVRAGEDTVLEWTTASETGTLGFYVSRFENNTHRWVPMHNGLIVSLHESMGGGTYRVIDPSATDLEPTRYRIEELDRNGLRMIVREEQVYTLSQIGTRLDLQPAVGWQAALTNSVSSLARTASSYNNVLRSASLTGAVADSGLVQSKLTSAVARTSVGSSLVKPSLAPSKTKTPGAATVPALHTASLTLPIHPAHVSTAPKGFRIETSEQGLHRISLGELSLHAGLPVDELVYRAQNGSLALSERGNPVPCYFDKGATQLVFYAAAPSATYSGRNVYQLRFASAKPMGALTNKPNGSETVDKGVVTQVIEQDALFAAAAATNAEQDNWYWAPLSAGSDRYETFSTEFDMGAMAMSGNGDIEIALSGAWGLSETSVQQIDVAINGSPVGAIQVKAMGNLRFTLPLQMGVLKAGKNTLALKASSQALPGTVGVYIDRFTFTAVRSLKSDGKALEFEALVDGATQVLMPTTRYLAYDIDLGGVVPMPDAVASAGSMTLTIPTQAGHHYALSALTDMSAVVTMAPIYERGLRSSGLSAEYVVIAPSAVDAASQRLGMYRKGQGLKTAVVSLQDIYDAYSYSYPTPYAIRDFLRYVYEQGGAHLKYAVLLGNGSFDYKGVTAEGPGLVPPKLVLGEGGLSASDVWFADVVGDDTVPDFAIGRLPATNINDAGAMIDRMVEFEKNLGKKYAYDALSLVGTKRNDDFSKLSELLNNSLENKKLFLTVDVDTMSTASARDEISKALNAGVFWFNYIGHAGVTQFDDTGVVRSEDITSLASPSRPGIWTAMTCSAGRFEIPGVRSVGEAVLGSLAVALWSDTGLSYAYPAARLSAEFATRASSAMKSEGAQRLGDVLLSIHQSASDAAFSRSMMQTYVLLGDPALMLPEGNGIAAGTDENSGGITGGGCAVHDYSMSEHLAQALAMMGLLTLFALRRRRQWVSRKITSQ